MISLTFIRENQQHSNKITCYNKAT